jgi:hypothetical protein
VEKSDGIVLTGGVMCSGCAGDYSGGFDADEHDEFGGNSGDESGGERFISANGGAAGLGCGKGADLGASIHEDAFAEPPDGAVENYEVLVSGTQIVELRMFSISLPQESDPGVRGFWGRAIAGTQSHAKGAKYYPTRAMQADGAHSATQMAHLVRESASAAGFWRKCTNQCGKRMRGVWRKLRRCE